MSKYPIAIVLLLLSTTVFAQSPTTGAISGKVTDKATHEGLVGITVIIKSQARGDEHSAFTDVDGTYKIDDLLPGDYVVNFYAEKTQQSQDIHVGANQTVPVFAQLQMNEIIEIHDRLKPLIILDRTDQGFKRNQQDMQSLPQPGSTIDTQAGAAAGAANDGLGVSFSGSTSLENRYLVDGIDITGLTYGTVGTPVLNEFVEELEVLTGGYNAEWGRATGGIVNAVTKTGTNEFKGSIFGRITPGVLTRAARVAPINAASIDVTGDKAYDANFGVELGGPIVRDHLWFYAGVAPTLERTDYTRTTKRQTDCRKVLDNGKLSDCDARIEADGGNANGQPDIDPKTGFYITDNIDSEVRAATTRSYSLLGKVNLAVSPQHQAQVTAIVVPSSSRTPGLVGDLTSGTRSKGLTTDLAARWTSKLNQDRTELEATLAWHRSHIDSGSIDPSLDSTPRQFLTDGTLGVWTGLGGESQKTADYCKDGTPNDNYTLITNCPMRAQAYATGGPGTVQNDTEERRTIRLSATQRAKAIGTHELKAGLDYEDDRKIASRLYSGGAFIQNDVGASTILVTRYVQLAAPGDADPRFDHTCSTPSSDTGPTGKPKMFRCEYTSGVAGDPGTQVSGQTGNWAAYLRDSWQPMSSLTFNLGARYEEQKLYYAKQQRGTVDPLTGNTIGDVAMNLKGNLAPRIGVMWDPTDEGRAKVFAAFGRFYESIPMDINDRSFGGEVTDVQTFGGAACGPIDPKIGGANGTNCKSKPSTESLLGSSGVLVAPGIKAEYLDEILGGLEWMIDPHTKLGITYQHRSLGRVIEDVSTDGAQTYVIANPGEFADAEQTRLETAIARTDDAAVKAKLANELKLYKGIRSFDRPSRDYHAVQLTLGHRATKGLFLEGSYTYSRTFGNYPGSASYDNGQVDPNISSQYDLIELLSNRYGALPQDRPHSLKLDGYYTWQLPNRQRIVIGARARATSGTPINALGAHYLYGPDESFLLPRGALGRTPLEHSFDLHLSYGKALTKTTAFEVFADVFNLYNNQGTFGVDQTYAPAVTLDGTLNNVNPISGGTYKDLIWAKSIDAAGSETASPIGRNPNFKNTVSRYAPTSAQVGFRILF